VFALIVLWVYAAVSKLFRFALFRFQLNTYPWIRQFAGLVVWSVPLLELVIAALLISGRRRIIGLYASLCLLVVFTVYLIWMLRTEKHLPCSCGGVIQELSWNQHLVFNVFFIAVAATGIVGRRRQQLSSPKHHIYET
jgi:uncharacterized membrane protein YphA (DoxX/SURF4 family)